MTDDTRLLSLEREVAAIQSRTVSSEKEIESLRLSRHDYGAKLQVHTLEIELLKQAVTGGHGVRIDKLEEQGDGHERAIADLRSDLRVVMIKVSAISGAISGAIFFALNLVVNHLLK